MNTLLIAHPDDEVIFFWWALKEIDKIVCCSSDLNNPERVWCKNRKKALFAVGEALNVPVKCFDYNSEFHRLQPRIKELINLQSNIKQEVEGTIYTHNFWGEYGHLDHILVNQIALSLCNRMVVSDIVDDGQWFNVRKLNQGRLFRQAEIDMDLYNQLKEIYDKHGCWTWSREPIKECFIYEIDNRLV
jgi:LmbE family N-acetylglucosaminyl deacetylase